jgi:hypothetical protein
MMRAALARVTISEYFCILQKPHTTGRRRKRRRLSGQSFATQAFFPINGWFVKQIAGWSVMACLTRWRPVGFSIMHAPVFLSADRAVLLAELVGNKTL